MRSRLGFAEALVVALVAAYLAQGALVWCWPGLGAWQDHDGWKLGSGLALLAVVGWMWLQAWIRVDAGPAVAARWLPLHRLGGSLAVAALFLHAAGPGPGFLGPLAAVLLGNAVLGAVSPQAVYRWRGVPAGDGYRRAWITAHIVLALVLAAGIGYHLWIGLTYA